MKIYTKTGDGGQTGLIGGTRVHKNDLRIEAYGTVDELNAHIGMLSTYNIIPASEMQLLSAIQNQLFVIGSYLATDREKADAKKFITSDDAIILIEKHIDAINEQLPALTKFILPGGGKAGAQCHICRTVARRTERRITQLQEIYNIDIQIIKYINRLSDYFFTLSRLLNQAEGKEEKCWIL